MVLKGVNRGNTRRELNGKLGVVIGTYRTEYFKLIVEKCFRCLYKSAKLFIVNILSKIERIFYFTIFFYGLVTIGNRTAEIDKVVSIGNDLIYARIGAYQQIKDLYFFRQIPLSFYMI